MLSSRTPKSPPLRSILRRGGVVLAVTLALSVSEIIISTPAAAQESGGLPIEFTADAILSDTAAGTMTATGNVVITQGDTELRADRIEYHRDDARAIATGNVAFTDNQGGVHYAENLTMEENFSRAFAENVISRMSDGSWVGSAGIEHERDVGSEFTASRFTPCNCEFREGEEPAWELRSATSRHDEVGKTVYHQHVRMHLFSVPVMYFPYLSHPDWTVRRQSGLLPPRVSFSSDLGTTYSQSFYWVTGETHDLEITPKIFTNNGDALELNYRQRWDESGLDARLIGGRLNTFKKDREDVAGIDATFTTTLADSWKTAARIHRTSQDTFMRRYGFDKSESLKTYISSEQVESHRYSLVETYELQDLRSDSSEETEPVVFPHVFHERYLESPREDLALRMRVGATSINNDDHTDVRRWTSEIYGLEEFGARFGIFSAEGRVSAQYRDIETATNNNGYTGELGQGTAAAGIGWSMPIAAMVGASPVVAEPKVKLVSVRASDHGDKIPNRDSADFRLDEANLFLLHREQGEDYSITHSRVDAGLSVSLYDRFLGDVAGFIGSSMRVSGKTPEGLNAVAEGDRFSDILASVSVQPTDDMAFDWFGRLHPRDLTLNETRASASVAMEETSLNVTYRQLGQSFFDTANEEKEELIVKATQKLPKEWSLVWTQKYDMADNKRELEESKVEVNYAGGLQDCLTVSLGYSRDTTTDRDIKPVDEVFLILNFKYLGAIKSSEVSR